MHRRFRGRSSRAVYDDNVCITGYHQFGNTSARAADRCCLGPTTAGLRAADNVRRTGHRRPVRSDGVRRLRDHADRTVGALRTQSTAESGGLARIPVGHNLWTDFVHVAGRPDLRQPRCRTRPRRAHLRPVRSHLLRASGTTDHSRSTAVHRQLGGRGRNPTRTSVADRKKSVRHNIRVVKTRRYRLLLVAGMILVVVAGLVLGPLKTPVLYLWNAECFGWSASSDGPRLVALGDSIAEGNSVVDWGIHGDTSWYSHLVCGGGSAAADGRNAGATGETTAQIAARMDEALAAEPDVLVVNGGTNDQARGVPLAETIANLRSILDQARGVDTVVLATVPPSRSAPDDRLNIAIRNLAAERGLPLADFASTLRTPGATFDGVHPTADSARSMAEQVVVAAGLR